MFFLNKGKYTIPRSRFSILCLYCCVELPECCVELLNGSPAGNNTPAAYHSSPMPSSGTSYSKIRPSLEIVTTCQGMNLPLSRSAFSAALCSPPQQGTSIRTMVTLLMSLSRMISVSFSE